MMLIPNEKCYALEYVLFEGFELFFKLSIDKEKIQKEIHLTLTNDSS